MSGHSKWHNIKRKKESKDAKRGEKFTKLSRQISVVTKQGGGDPDSNSSLRLAIEKAKAAKMPKSNIERAIRRGLGRTDVENYEELVYEGFGPEGVAFLVYTLTDNKNRTVASIKNLFAKYDGSLGQPGSTSHIFVGETKEPSFKIFLEKGSALGRVLDLEKSLMNHDDVQEIYSNYEKS